MPNHKTPSAAPTSSSRSRSSSLQRMLDMEKQYMLDRMHGHGHGRGINASGNATAKTASASTNSGSASAANSISLSTSTSNNINHDISGSQIHASPDSSDTHPWPPPLSRKPLAVDTNNPKVNASTYTAGIDPPLLSPSQTPSQSPLRSHAPHSQAHPQPRPRTRSSSRSSGPPQLKLDLHLPPLTIPIGEYRVPDTKRDILSSFSSTPTDPKPRQKTAAFQFPPETDDEDLRSTCQSPSWEAYGRRKKERKEKKEEEKRGREHMDKDNKTQKRQVIRKQPPSASASASASRTNQKSTQRLSQSITDLSVSTTTLPSAPSPQKQRPASVLGLPTPTPIKDDSGRRTRSRSGSFTSLFRVSFDTRRASVDEGSRDVGFIGGVKLDQQRKASHQKALDEQLKAAEADIHPALRQSRPNLSASNHFEQSSGAKDTNANRRAYPPITRQPIPSKARSAPQAVAGSPDHSMINKWRARVGLKPKHKAEPAPAGVASLSKADISQPIAVNSSLSKEMGEASASSNALAKAGEQQMAVNPALKDGDKANAKRRTRQIQPIDTRAVSADDPDMPTSLSPPPAPPRRSSKRNSVLSLQGLPAGSLPTPDSASRSRSQSPDRRAAHTNASDLPVSTVVSTPAGEWRLSPANPWASRRPTSSSEDSYSEEFHSPSPASTPDTSRPQSEKDLAPVTADAERRFRLDPEHASKPTKTSPLNYSTTALNTHIAQIPDEDDSDPIQTAARKVMAAFPDLQPPQRLSTDRRSQSESNISRDSFLPKMKGRDKGKDTEAAAWPLAREEEPNSPPLRDLILTKDQSSVAAPWPATYLEAARKAAPPPAAPRPANPNPLRNLLPPSQGALSSTFGTRQLGQPPNALGIEAGGEPLAKMFVECCSCRYYHDMPSKLYAAMSNPGGVVSPKGSVGFEGAISMTVKCPWCKHEMSTKCCAGLAALVYVKERLH